MVARRSSIPTSGPSSDVGRGGTDLDQRRPVADDFSSGRVDPLVERSLTALVAEATRRTPEATAVVGLAGADAGAGVAVTLTYADLERRAEAVAASLRAVGVGPEVTVGVCLLRSAAQVVALLGVLRAGGAFVPLDGSWPARRISAVADEAGIAAVVAGAAGAPPELSASAGFVPLLRLDPAGRLVTAGGGTPARAVSADNPHPYPAVDLENLAYVIYTSGSTGTPKGVMIRHQAICNRLRWQVDLLGLTGDDVVLHKAPLSIDISINEILLPLVAGALMVIAPPGAEADPGALLEIIRAHSVTFCYVAPSTLGAMLECPDAVEAGRSLRHVWCGGEVLRDEAYRRFRERWRARLYHGYGPAEATIGVSCRVFDPDQATARVSIGRPNPNTQLRVLDAEYNPVPLGAVGELFISGLPLARGYLNDPRRTADQFVPDPFSPVPGSRMYATGGLGRFRADGEIEFLGRADNQVKIRGFRVELEEIENVLCGQPGIRQAAVVLVPGQAGDDGELRAYCVRAGASGPPNLRACLAERLPEHMVPDTFVDVAELPLTAAGKIDRSALAAPGPPGPPAANDHPHQRRNSMTSDQTTTLAGPTTPERSLDPVPAASAPVEQPGRSEPVEPAGPDDLARRVEAAQHGPGAHALVRSFASNPAFRPAEWEELTTEDDPYRRPVRPADLAWLDYGTALGPEDTLKLSGLLGHRMLRNIYDADLLYLPPNRNAAADRDASDFYGAGNRLRGALAQPVLERHLFSFLAHQRPSPPVGPSAGGLLSELRGYWEERRDHPGDAFTVLRG
ncbi:amino acid adenylation domain-containing protein, partial [Frankia sp. CcWB2]